MTPVISARHDPHRPARDGHGVVFAMVTSTSIWTDKRYLLGAAKGRGIQLSPPTLSWHPEVGPSPGRSRTVVDTVAVEPRAMLRHRGAIVKVRAERVQFRRLGTDPAGISGAARSYAAMASPTIRKAR